MCSEKKKKTKKQLKTKQKTNHNKIECGERKKNYFEIIDSKLIPK